VTGCGGQGGRRRRDRAVRPASSSLRRSAAELATHTSAHRDLSRFGGKRVLVVGGGQSALESAALLHEAGADVEVLVRKDHLIWLHGGKYHRMLGRYSKLVYAPTDVGPMGCLGSLRCRTSSGGSALGAGARRPPRDPPGRRPVAGRPAPRRADPAVVAGPTCRSGG
jgi:hypothetical protein